MAHYVRSIKMPSSVENERITDVWHQSNELVAMSYNCFNYLKFSFENCGNPFPC